MLPSIAVEGLDCKLTWTSVPGEITPMACSDTEKTPSRASSWEITTIICPALTTWPGSAPTLVTAPAVLAFSVV